MSDHAQYLLLLGITCHTRSLHCLLVKSDTLIPALSFKAAAVVVGMTGLAAALVWCHAVMCMHVLSSASAASLRQKQFLQSVPVLPTISTYRHTPCPSRWPQNNKCRLHHQSYLLGSPPPPLQLRLILPDHGSTKSCLAEHGHQTVLSGSADCVPSAHSLLSSLHLGLL